ncbi:hypothetical protein B0H19DRAFT_1264606 [Mycena capillaripes]|nr:hypothetical protein B0H19DRAFT_1264606 [Mycena capillaripes]
MAGTAVEVSSSVRGTRRRSLKGILLGPLLPRQPGFGPSSFSGASGPGISLPGDILREVAELLSPNDILSVSLTASHVRMLLIPELYRTVHLRSSRTCDSGLRMLKARPELCAHIHKLAVRPNYYLAWPARDTQLSEEWVATMISRIAGTLTNLRTFDWDGLEMPRDGLWLTLRKSCPSLKELFSNVGFQPLDPESELFKFSDLAIFSLSVRHGLGETDIFPSHEDLPPQLWDMILNRCPHLTELTLCSFSASNRLFAIDRVAEGHWPDLSSLTLGAFGYNSDFTLAAPPAAPFATFLAAHPELTYLRLAWNFKRWMSPDEGDAFGLTLPTGLDAFSGIVQQLPGPSIALTPLAALTSLDLMCEPLYAARAPALCAALRALPSLTSLELWVHVPEPRAGHEAFFSELWGSAPKLEDLHFMCTTAFGKKPLTELACALRFLPNLRTFALTKGHRYADESMRRSAVRVFNACAYGMRATSVESGTTSSPSRHQAACASPTAEEPETEQRVPRLTQVSIRWARAACRNHLKQEGTYDRVVPPLPPPPSAAGAGARESIDSNNLDKYDMRVRGRRRGSSVSSASRREKDMVEAWERGLRAVGGAFERKYQFALPPVPVGEREQRLRPRQQRAEGLESMGEID